MNRMDKRSGIYLIRCDVNGRVYIGSAKNLDRRLYEHRRELRQGKHCNGRLQNAFNKYGEAAFSFLILEECAIRSLITREQFYINLYDSARVGFNIASVAYSQLGFRHSEASKKKMSLSHMGQKPTPEVVMKRSIKLRGRKRSADAIEKTASALRGRVSPIRGRKFIDEHKRNISTALKGTRRSNYSRSQHALNRGGKPFYCIETNKEYINQTEAAEELGLRPQDVNRALRGQRASAKGYRFEYVNPADRPAHRKAKAGSREHCDSLARAHGGKPFTCMQTGVVYQNINSAARELGLHPNAIYYVLKGKFSQTGGFSFQYLN